jgi:hypothetical protein
LIKRDYAARPTPLLGFPVGILGQLMLNFRIPGHIMLDFLSDDRTCASENKELAVATSSGQIMVD